MARAKHVTRAAHDFLSLSLSHVPGVKLVVDTYPLVAWRAVTDARPSLYHVMVFLRLKAAASSLAHVWLLFVAYVVLELAWGVYVDRALGMLLKAY